MPEEAAPAPAPKPNLGLPIAAGVIGIAGVIIGLIAFNKSKEVDRLTVDVAQAQAQLVAAKVGFSSEIESLRNDAWQQHEASRNEAQSQITAVKTQADAQISQLKSEGDNRIAQLKADFAKQVADLAPAKPIALFNGKDLEGWEPVGGALDNWKVEEGLLVCTGGKGAKWISTKETYGDFDLSLEYKLSEGGNSGVFIRTPRQGDPAYVGMEIQVIDDDGYEAKHKATLKDWQKTGSIYAVVAPSKSVSRKAGEWNHMRIRAEGGLVFIWLNGERTIDADTAGYTQGKPPLHARPRVGYIGLQNHGARLEYRNILIRRL